MNVLVGFRDIGGANAVLPVAQCARREGHTVIIYGEGAALTRFKNDFRIYDAGKLMPESIMVHHQPNIVVTTTDSPGGMIPRGFTEAAVESGIPVLAVQDFWGNHAKALWPHQPTAFAVQDEFAVGLLRRDFPDVRVSITGQPAFDTLSKVDPLEAGENLRVKLKLRHDVPIVAFPGQIWGMASALWTVLRGLEAYESLVYFTYRHHPRLFQESTPTGQKEILARYQEVLKSAGPNVLIVDSTACTADEVAFGSDVLVGAYSTELVRRCYLKAEAVSLMIDEVRQALFWETKSFDIFPPVALGACRQATNVLEFVDAVRKALTPPLRSMPDEVLWAQEKHYLSDGRAAERVWELAKTLVK